MDHSLSIVIPHRCPVETVLARLVEIVVRAEQLARDWELVFVYSSGSPDCPSPIAVPAEYRHRVRWMVPSDSSTGLSAAITTGLLAARGERILVIELGDRFPTDQWSHLLRALERFDAVFGCCRESARRFSREGRLGDSLPLYGTPCEVDGLLWGLRRDVARSLRLDWGMHTQAASLLALQGRTVGEVIVEHRLGVTSEDWPDPQSSLLNWAAMRWLARRRVAVDARELDVCDASDCAAEPLSMEIAALPENSVVPTTPTSRDQYPRPLHVASTAHHAKRPPLTIFFSAGEPSGDMHGANLISALNVRCGKITAVGFGGPRMRSAGCRLHFELTRLAIMGISRVLWNLPKFFRLVAQANQHFASQRPDAVVLIDYPGFNWWIARRAKAHGIPVFYYSPPQIWAWASWRVRKMRRYVDHVLCGLPFEEKWFNEHGCRAQFIGHPYFDEVRGQRLDAKFVDEQRTRPGRLVTLLPGSRTQEVEHNLPAFLSAAEIVFRAVPESRFAVAAFREEHAERARRLIASTTLPMEVHVGRTPELIAAADCCLAVSGSVSLELLHHAKPTVVHYRVGRIPLLLQRFVRRVKYISLVNLMATDELHPRDTSFYDPRQPDAQRVLFPEYITVTDRSSDMAAHLIEWLTDRARRAVIVERLEALREQVGQAGAACRAAEYIEQAVSGRCSAAGRPHFIPGQSTLSGYRYSAS